TILNDFRLTFEYRSCEITNGHKFYGALFNYENALLLKNAKFMLRPLHELTKLILPTTFRSISNWRVNSYHYFILK
ncbi:MAG: hypothetical protein AAF634_13705, partial [Bacteroidota bacterium]